MSPNNLLPSEAENEFILITRQSERVSVTDSITSCVVKNLKRTNTMQIIGSSEYHRESLLKITHIHKGKQYTH